MLFASKDIKVGEELRYDYGGGDLPWRTRIKKIINKGVQSTEDGQNANEVTEDVENVNCLKKDVANVIKTKEDLTNVNKMREDVTNVNKAREDGKNLNNSTKDLENMNKMAEDNEDIINKTPVDNSNFCEKFKSHLENERIDQDRSLSRIGKYRIKIPEDGNCLFRAVGSQLRVGQESHLILRKKACEWLRQNTLTLELADGDSTCDEHAHWSNEGEFYIL